MRRIVVRAPACSADSIVYLTRVFRIHAEELKQSEQVEFAFNAERFPFADAIFESLMKAAGLRVLAARIDGETRIFAAEKG